MAFASGVSSTVRATMLPRTGVVNVTKNGPYGQGAAPLHSIFLMRNSPYVAIGVRRRPRVASPISIGATSSPPQP